MMRLVTLLLIGFMVAPGPATADPVAATDPVAETIIAAIDIRLTPEVVVAAGITTEFAQRLAMDPESRPYLRARAVSALAAIGDVDARRVIEAVAIIDTNDAVRAQAFISLARAYGPWDRAEVVCFLVERLAWSEGRTARRILAELRRLAQPPR